MTSVMKGVRVLEVSEHGFVPMAAALLSDWGAEVIKIEPAERGDAARGLNTAKADSLNVLFHHANRGKQSLGLDLATPEGREILYKLAEKADIFITNKLPGVRKKLQIDVEDIRARNPKIIYVRGGGQGARGPEADRGSYDLLAYWHRAGTSSSVASPQGEIPFLPSPGFGDFTGAMFIAGGVMGALFHRERTGETPLVDVSLLATGMWSMSSAISLAAKDKNWAWPPSIPNPMSSIYMAKDGRWLALCCLQAAKYWPLFWNAAGRPEIGADPRFADYGALFANGEAATALLREGIAERTIEEWRAALANFSGQWTVVQNAADVASDPQVAPNGYLQTVRMDDGEEFQLVTAPVQYDEQPAPTRRAPDFNEHGDAILAELGLDWDTVVDFKVRGIVT